MADAAQQEEGTRCCAQLGTLERVHMLSGRKPITKDGMCLIRFIQRSWNDKMVVIACGWGWGEHQESLWCSRFVSG